MHSYGHGQFCYYCGVDGDKEDEKPVCDYAVRQPPSARTMAAYDAQVKLSEKLQDIARDLEFGSELADVEKRLAEAIAEHRKGIPGS